MAGFFGKLTTALAAASLALSAHALTETPDQIIRTATDSARADIAQNVATYQKDKAALYRMADAIIVPHFDTPYIARVILGSHIKQANPEQIAQFETAFKDMLIHTYADKMLEYYDGIEIELKPARIDGKRANVDTTIVRKNGKPPIPITFSMRDVEGAWKIWDIKAENILVERATGRAMVTDFGIARVQVDDGRAGLVGCDRVLRDLVRSDRQVGRHRRGVDGTRDGARDDDPPAHLSHRLPPHVASAWDAPPAPSEDDETAGVLAGRERTMRLIDQMELQLEELEAKATEDELAAEAMSPSDSALMRLTRANR